MIDKKLHALGGIANFEVEKSGPRCPECGSLLKLDKDNSAECIECDTIVSRRDVEEMLENMQ